MNHIQTPTIRIPKDQTLFIFGQPSPFANHALQIAKGESRALEYQNNSFPLFARIDSVDQVLHSPELASPENLTPLAGVRCKTLQKGPVTW